MTPAQALSALWIAMTLGLAGCVSPSRETANTRCLEEVASSASYMSGGAPWDLATDPSDRSHGYVPGSRQRLEQDARAQWRDRADDRQSRCRDPPLATLQHFLRGRCVDLER